jgi:SRSO17 transposase
MTPSQMCKLDSEFREYMVSMVADMGRLERHRDMELCLTGLLLDGERKSVEPIGDVVEACWYGLGESWPSLDALRLACLKGLGHALPNLR